MNMTTLSASAGWTGHASSSSEYVSSHSRNVPGSADIPSASGLPTHLFPLQLPPDTGTMKR
jgi:hypothetical protein